MNPTPPVTDDRQRVPRPAEKSEQISTQHAASEGSLPRLQRGAGNHAVGQLLQRSGDGAFSLDEDTEGRINGQRGGGMPLDQRVNQRMSQAFGVDFGGVRVHTGGEADQLNHKLGARAFTTGSDIFFRQGEYQPSSSGGQELLAHELTHVVQQSSGRVGGSSGPMQVNAANDPYEQEADATARNVTNSINSSTSAPAGVQREGMPEEEEMLQAKRIQREIPEEELQTKRLQRQEEEEEMMLKRLQRQEEEEELMMKRDPDVQRCEGCGDNDQELG